MPLPYRFLYGIGLIPWDKKEVPTELVGVLDGADAPAPGRALDLGCGTGTQSVWLSRRGWDVVALDYIPRAIERARTRSRDMPTPPRWLVGDVTRLGDFDLGNDFDLVLDIGTLFAFNDAVRVAAFTTLATLTKPGALVVRFGLTDDEDRDAILATGWDLLWYRNERDARIKRKNASPAWSLLRRLPN